MNCDSNIASTGGKFFLPKNLELQIEQALHGRLKKFRDHACHFIHDIRQMTEFYELENSDFVRLKAAYIREILPWRDYTKVLSALVAAGLIEMHKKWSQGNYSMGYRLGESIRDLPFVRYESEHKVLKKKISKVKKKEDRRLTTVTKALELHYLRARIDESGARTWIDQNSTGKLAERHHKLLTGFVEGEHHYKTGQYGRLFTYVTNMKRELRQFLYFEGVNDGLTEFDIVNSQPFCLFVLLKSFNQGQQNPNCHIVLESAKEREEKGNSIRCDNFLPSDLVHYGRLVTDGVFYEFLAEKSSKSREQVKKAVMNLFFGKPDWKGWLVSIFETYFPTVIEFIRKENREKSNAVSHHLQRTESGFIFDVVCQHLIRAEPSLPILTVHDSLIVPSSSAEMVMDTITKLATVTYGFSPLLKTKKLTP